MAAQAVQALAALALPEAAVRARALQAPQVPVAAAQALRLPRMRRNTRPPQPVLNKNKSSPPNRLSSKSPNPAKTPRNDWQMLKKKPIKSERTLRLKLAISFPVPNSIFARGASI